MNINFVLVCAIIIIGLGCIWLLSNPNKVIINKISLDKIDDNTMENTNQIENQIENQIPMKTWADQLIQLETHGLIYPSNIKSRFFYETSVCSTNPSNNIFKDYFIESKELDTITVQDYTPFLEQIQDGSDINQIARSFYNKSGDTLLIIPYPHPTIQYPTIKEFIDNAPQEIKSEFWKFVVDQIKQFISTHSVVYISTHGLGVNYFNLRLCVQSRSIH